jgi:hypothetical protein
MTVELYGGPKDGERVELPQVVARLVFPTAVSAPPDEAKVHAYEWRASAQPSGYYYAGVVRA